MQLLKKQKGWTLLELMIGLMVFAVLTASVTALMPSVYKAYIRARNLAETNTLLNTLSTELLSDLSEAVTVTLEDAVTAEGQPVTDLIIRKYESSVVYTIGDDGFLSRNDFLVLAEGFYGKKTVTLAFYEPDGITLAPRDVPLTQLIVRLSLYASDDGELLASRDYAAMPMGTNNYA